MSSRSQHDSEGGPADAGGPDGDDVGSAAASAWRAVFERLFDPHPSHVALVGLDGMVLAVNAAWRRYGAANGLRAGYDFVGQNYLAACEAGVVARYPSAEEAYVGLLGVLRSGRPKFTLVYSCSTPDRRETYRMWVEPQSPSVPAVIVAHELIASRPRQSSDGPATFGVGPGPPTDAAAAGDPFRW